MQDFVLRACPVSLRPTSTSPRYISFLIPLPNRVSWLCLSLFLSLSLSMEADKTSCSSCGVIAWLGSKTKDRLLRASIGCGVKARLGSKTKYWLLYVSSGCGVKVCLGSVNVQDESAKLMRSGSTWAHLISGKRCRCKSKHEGRNPYMNDPESYIYRIGNGANSADRRYRGNALS